MSITSYRLLSLLLTASLMADPLAAAALIQDESTSRQSISPSYFQEQALSPSIQEFLKTLVFIKSFHHVQSEIGRTTNHTFAENTFGHVIDTIRIPGTNGRHFAPVPSISGGSSSDLSGLIRDLHSYDSERKRGALRRLAEVGPSAVSAIPDVVAMYGQISISEDDIDKTLRAIGPASSKELEGLQRLLGSYDSAIVERAARSLGEMKGAARPAIPVLVGLAGSVNSKVAESCNQALRNLAPASSDQVPHLLRLLKGYDSAVQTSAAIVLGEMGFNARAAIPDLVDLSGAMNSNLQTEVAKALVRIGPPETAQLNDLLRKLASYDSQVQIAAARAIGTMGSEAKAAIPDLESIVKHSANSTLVTTAKEAIAKVNQTGARQASEPSHNSRHPFFTGPTAKDNGPFPRSTAESKSQPVDVEALTRDLQSFQPSKVMNAARQLASLGSRSTGAIPTLISAVKRAPSSDKSELETILRSMGPASSDQLSDIVRLLGSFNPDEFRMAVIALENMGVTARSALPTLIEKVRGKSEKEREYVDAAIDRIGVPSSNELPQLIRLLSNFDVGVLKRALGAIGRMGSSGKSAIPEVLRLSRKSELRDSVRETLLKIGPAGSDQLNDIIGRLQVGDTEERIMAAQALGMMGAAALRAAPELERIAKYSLNPALQKAALEALWKISPNREADQSGTNPKTKTSSTYASYATSGFSDWADQFEKRRRAEQFRTLETYYTNALKRFDLAIRAGNLKGWQSLINIATEEKTKVHKMYEEAKQALSQGNDVPYDRFLLYVTGTAQIWLDWINKALGSDEGGTAMPTDGEITRGALKELKLEEMPTTLEELKKAHHNAIRALSARHASPDQVQGKLKLSDAERENNSAYKKAREEYQAINDAHALLEKILQKKGVQRAGKSRNSDKPGDSDNGASGDTPSPNQKLFLLDASIVLAGLSGVYSGSMGLAKIFIALHSPDAIVIAAGLILPTIALFYAWRYLTPKMLSRNPSPSSQLAVLRAYLVAA